MAVLEFNERLATPGGIGAETKSSPTSEQLIALGGQLFQQMQGTVAAILSCLQTAQREQRGNYRVDEDVLGTCPTQSFGAWRAGYIEPVAIIPIHACLYIEQVIEFLHIVGIEECR